MAVDLAEGVVGLGDVGEALLEADLVDSRRAGTFDRSRLAGDDAAVDALLGECDSSSEIFPVVLRFAAGVRVVDFLRGAGVRVGVLDRPRAVLVVDFGVFVEAVFLLVVDLVTDLGVEVAGVEDAPDRALGRAGVLAIVNGVGDATRMYERGERGQWTKWMDSDRLQCECYPR